MKTRTWTFTTIRNGQPVATRAGLGHDEAVRAIYAAMYGRDPFADEPAMSAADPTADHEPTRDPTTLAA